MTPFHTTNGRRVRWFLFLCYKSKVDVYHNEGHGLRQRKKKKRQQRGAMIDPNASVQSIIRVRHGAV